MAYLRFNRQDWLIGLLIVFLAFSYRLIIIVDRAETPGPVSAFDPLPSGSDQFTYYHAIEDFRAGTFPPQVYFYQPGPSWLMVGLSQLLRTDNLGALRVAVAWLAAVNCGVMIAVARLAFGRPWVSYLAGGILAVYPVSAFFDTDFVITSQSTILLTLALFGVLWAWRQPTNWTGVVLFGLSSGLIVLMRRELVVIAPVMGLWLLGKVRRWRTVIQLGLAALIALGVTAPVILHNRAGGADYLITPVGMTEIYRGHHRDSGGTYEHRQASETTVDNYLYFLGQDFNLSPARFFQLELRKIGLYLSSQEPGNNLNYLLSGKDISPALAANPLNFSIVLALFLLGLWQAARTREETWTLWAVVFLACMASALLIWVEARIRTPVIISMIPAAAYGLIVTGQHIRDGLHSGRTPWNWRHGIQWAVPVGMIAGVLVFSDWTALNLPARETTALLPSTAQPTSIVYDNTLELVGWEIEEPYSRAGLIQPFKPYVVTFYWRVLKPTSINYSFALGFFVGDERILGTDKLIGTVAYPEFPTSQWQPDTIYVEHSSITYKRFDGPVMQTGELLLNVYPERDAEALLPAVGLEGEPPFVRLTQPAIMLGNGKLDTLTAGETGVLFGDVLTLKAWAYSETTALDEPVPIQLGWETTTAPIDRSYSIGVYAFSADGQVVGQADSPPHGGQLLTWSLPIHFLFEDSKTLDMPDQAGRYSLYVSVYDQATMERLSVPDTTDNLFKLGDITLQP